MRGQCDVLHNNVFNLKNARSNGTRCDTFIRNRIKNIRSSGFACHVMFTLFSTAFTIPAVGHPAIGGRGAGGGTAGGETERDEIDVVALTSSTT